MISRYLDNKKIFIIWIIIAFFVRAIGFIIFAQTGNTGIADDTLSYTNAADTFLKNDTFGATYRSPGYPILIVLMKILCGEYYYYGIVVAQVILNIVSIWYLIQLADLMFNKRIAMLVCIFEVFNILNIHYSYMILTDSITRSISIICLYYIYRFVKSLVEKEVQIIDGVIGAILLMICIMIRPAFYYLPVCFIIGYVFVVLYTRTIDKKIWLKVIIVSIVTLMITYTPTYIWTQHNIEYMEYQGYSPVKEITAYQYHSAVVYAKQNDISYYEAYDALVNNEDEGLKKYLENMPLYDAYGERANELILSDLPYYFFCCGIDLICLFFYPGIMDIKMVHEPLEQFITHLKSNGFDVNVILSSEYIVYEILLALNILFLAILFISFVVGLFKYIKNNSIVFSGFWIGIIFYFIVIYAQPEGYGSFPRFRTALSAFCLLFSAFEFDNILRKLNNKKNNRVDGRKNV